MFKGRETSKKKPAIPGRGDGRLACAMEIGVFHYEKRTVSKKYKSFKDGKNKERGAGLYHYLPLQ